MQFNDTVQAWRTWLDAGDDDVLNLATRFNTDLYQDAAWSDLGDLFQAATDFDDSPLAGLVGERNHITLVREYDNGEVWSCMVLVWVGDLKLATRSLELNELVTRHKAGRMAAAEALGTLTGEIRVTLRSLKQRIDEVYDELEGDCDTPECDEPYTEGGDGYANRCPGCSDLLYTLEDAGQDVDYDNDARTRAELETAVAALNVPLVWEDASTGRDSDQHADSRLRPPQVTSAYYQIGPEVDGWSLTFVTNGPGGVGELLLGVYDTEDNTKGAAQRYEDGKANNDD